ncbi:hypothetical protein ACKWTF_011282 [Chironomus riparius]
MAQTTGVLPFVRTIDFSRNDFSNDLPQNLKLLSGLQHLKLDKTNLNEIPDELGKLTKLENISMKNNQLQNLYGEISTLNNLRSLNIRNNNIKTSGVPNELFNLFELTTLDLSHNKLKEIPEGLDKAKGLLVLNLSHNLLCVIPNGLFVNLTDLLFLDLSNNFLETLPPQTRRLTNLQTLILNNNPLELFQLRQLPSLQNLEVLQMRNTQRNLLNFPTSLDNLNNLVELDISENNLPKIPEVVFNLINLKRLNVSENEIKEISPKIEALQKLETLNLSRNELTTLPNTLCKLSKLRKLYINENSLNFDGIPSGIGKLGSLEIFSAACNQLEMVPESLFRCGSLKKLNLSFNQLITLPDTIYLLGDMDMLDLRNNPDLIMPAKPIEMQKGDGVEFYNIDFSLQNQLRLAGAQIPPSVASSSTPNPKDAIARKMRLRRSRANGDQDSAKILKGMKDIAEEKNNNENGDNAMVQSLQPKRWEETLEKPPLDYSEFFENEDGNGEGLTIWEIENFLPNKIDEVTHGKFYEGDCYIVLKTFVQESQLSWEIYFWIGSNTSLDKKACAAIHAVNLRNYLGARCRTIREEQGDESDEFLALFDNDIVYIEGEHTGTGFFSIESSTFNTRLYVIHNDETTLHLEPVTIDYSSLDIHNVYLLDSGLKLFLWFGKKAKNTVKSKARLMTEKINKNERKNKAEIMMETQGQEGVDFLKLLNVTDPDEKPELKTVPDEWIRDNPRLYIIQLGLGYLEMPQVTLPQQKLVHTLLNSKNVYLLDCGTDLFVWFGKKSTRLVRAAAVKLSTELFNMIKRPPFSTITRVQEGTETQIFKSKFVGWDEVIAVDFTRTAQSVQRTGADLAKWAQKQETKADLAALFMPRQPSMTALEAQQLAEDWNYDLDAMENFVLEGKKFIRLPEEELGIFHSAECYVFLCRYCIPVDDDEVDGAENVQENAHIPEDEIQCVVYFWQGRDAGNMGWLTFTFTLQKKFKAMFGETLEVVRIHQQQENLKFMSHFKGKFIIKSGKRLDKKKNKETKLPVEFYHLRQNGSSLCTRLIQVRPDATLLNSAFCYILIVPFETADDSESGIIYVWIGSKTTAEEAKLIQEIAETKFNNPWYSYQVINEGEEPQNFFWIGLNGQKPHDTDAEFMNYTRLFRCSNEKGYFTVAEKCSDFCQDDLADDDIMLLDNGEQIFLWLGSRCSEVEIKLAYKSAQVRIKTSFMHPKIIKVNISTFPIYRSTFST